VRAIFGVVSLLVAVAIVGLLASRQWKAVHSSVASAGAQAALPGASAAPAPAGTVREQSQLLQQRVVSDVAKAMEQGARQDESDK
jgi:hypothetical protein